MPEWEPRLPRGPVGTRSRNVSQHQPPPAPRRGTQLPVPGILGKGPMDPHPCHQPAWEEHWRASIMFTVWPQGPSCYPAGLLSKLRGQKLGQGREPVTPYLLLTCPEGFGVADSRASPPDCASQGVRTADRQLLCARGDILQHPPFCCCPKTHPCRKRKQSITSG